MTERSWTVGLSLTEAARRWPDRPALTMGVRSATYTELLDEASAFARGLSGLGIKRGDKVGTLLHNRWECVVAFYASSLLGATLVPFNARYRVDELQFVVGHSDIVGLLTASHESIPLDLSRVLTAAFPVLANWSADRPLDIAEAPMLRWVADLSGRPKSGWISSEDIAAAAAEVSSNTVSDEIGETTP